MMPRARGASRPCTLAQARRRLEQAKEFLEAAELMDAPNVKATNAIHAAIAAADAITCRALTRRSSDGNHREAADLLGSVDPRLGVTLKRALDRKSQAAYLDDVMALSDAANCVLWARRLVDAAERQLRT